MIRVKERCTPRGALQEKRLETGSDYDSCETTAVSDSRKPPKVAMASLAMVVTQTRPPRARLHLHRRDDLAPELL